jgi:hypothetical protein
MSSTELERIKATIAEVVVDRERLKAEMEQWYSGRWKGSFPKAAELERLDATLSALDSRFKTLWDASKARSSIEGAPEQA